MTNVVGTVLLTSIENPMCRGCDNYKPEISMLENWLRTLRDCTAVVLHDELSPGEIAKGSSLARVPVQFVKVYPDGENLFFQRWRLWHLWLSNSPHVEYVWFTDGSDVRMLNTPWVHMRPMTLYVGSEDDVLSNRWIVDNHPTIRDLATRAKHQPLANAGLLGGDRITVLNFLDRLIWRLESSAGDLTDMAAFNLTLYEDWDGYVETGYPVHTTFNAWVKSDPQALWAHK